MTKISVFVDYANHAEEHSVEEDDALSASPKACAAIDAWLLWRKQKHSFDPANFTAEGRALDDALEALELATRNSPLRKVKP